MRNMTNSPRDIEVWYKRQADRLLSAIWCSNSSDTEAVNLENLTADKKTPKRYNTAQIYHPNGMWLPFPTML